MERSGAFNVDHLHREDLLRLMEQVAGMLGQGLTSAGPAAVAAEGGRQLAELEQVEGELQEWEEPATLPGPLEEEEEEGEGLVYDEDEEPENIEPVTTKAPCGKRGKSLKWTVKEKFDTKEDFDMSEVKVEIETKFKPRKVRSTEYSEKALFECHFHRKTHYKSCPVKYQVNYSNSCDEVLVETVGDHEHTKEEDENTEQKRNYLKWTDEQSKIVLEGVKHNMDPTNIKRALKDSNLFTGIFPTLEQINNKIAKVRKLLVKTKITMTADLRTAIENITEEPDDENEPFIVDYKITDDEGQAKVSFHCTWSTKKMKRRINSELAQGDATYRLNWQGFPVLVSGTSSTTGKFFPWAVTLTSKENTAVWSSVFSWAKSVLGGVAPRKVLGDAARDLTKASREEFGEDTKRLMCWPHTSKNIDDNLVILQRESKNPELAQKIKTDIDFFQWATTETEYETNFKVLVEKYTKEENVVNYTPEEEDATVKFFKFFDATWGPKTAVKNWFAGSNPFSLTQNQGIEGKNKAIKASYTFKTRVSIGKLFQIMQVMLRDWSEQDDNLVTSHRLALLEGSEGLSLKTNGWKWAQENAKHMKTKSVLSVDVSTRLGVHSVCEVAGLGKPSRILVVGRKEPRGELTSLAKVKLEERARPITRTKRSRAV